MGVGPNRQEITYNGPKEWIETASFTGGGRNMGWDDGLRGVHLAIASEAGSPVRVLAGPGTGKTYAMMRRIARLLEGGADPRRILVVSFTRTAARDLQDQLGALDPPGAADVRATTLHSLSFTFLNGLGAFQLTGRVPRPLLSYEVAQLVNDLKGAFGGKKLVTALIEAYEAAWAREQIGDPGQPAPGLDEDFHREIQEWLRYHRAMLIGEVVPLALWFLAQNPAVDDIQTFDHVLVDEYQDLNRADQALVERLGDGGSLAVIGDDNQSIYRFRHANPEGIRNFHERFENTVSYEILECRRCPANLVAMSNSLIERDSGRTRETPLVAADPESSAIIHVVQHRSLDDEADAIAAFVDDFLQRNPDCPPGQVLVLSPRRIVGNAIRDQLIRRGQQALSYFYEDALAPTIAAEGFALLTLLVKPDDRAAFRAWVGLGQPTGGFSAGYVRLRQAAEGAGVEPRELCQQVAAGNAKVPYTTKVVGRAVELENRLGGLQNLTGPDLVAALWPDIPEIRDMRLLAQGVAQFQEEPEAILSRLYELLTQPDLPDSEGDIIRIMSLHKSKGLTARVVVVAGCVAGALPSAGASLSEAEQDAMLQEQRRLFYVALTRATEVLVLSSFVSLPAAQAHRATVTPVGYYQQDGQTFIRAGASQFLGELGPSAPAALTGAAWRQMLGI